MGSSVGRGEGESLTALGGSTAPGTILRTKLRPPRVGHGWIPRPSIVGRLLDLDGPSLVLVDAPVGYGKTMLLAEWATTDERRRFAWLSLDRADDDPMRLITHLIAAVEAWAPGFGSTVLPAVVGSSGRIGDAVLARFVNELAELPGPTVIVLDDYHVLRDRRVHAVLEHLLEGLPSSVQLGVATRADPPLPLGRLRANRDLLELRAADLRFGEAESRTMLEAAGVELEETDLRDLVERTEGWPAGLYLAALSLRKESDPGALVRRFTGTHRHVADYLSEEVLRREPDAIRTFLARTSILERMSAPLCDAVLGSEDSATMLHDLERSNLFVIRLDEDRTWYRYHHLFGQMLEAELARTEPNHVEELHRRASRWFEANGWHEDAIRHALAAGDTQEAGALVARHWRVLVTSGHILTVQRWLRELGEDATARNPGAAIAAAWVSIMSGDPDAMERWLKRAETTAAPGALPDGTASAEAGVAIVRGIFGLRGVGAMRRSLERAVELEPPESSWWPYIQLGLGLTAYLQGKLEEASARLSETIERTSESEPLLSLAALCQLSVVQTELGQPREALRLADDALGIIEFHGLWSEPRVSLYWLARGTALRALGEPRNAADCLERSLEVRRSAGQLNPSISLQVVVALAPMRFDLGDPAGAEKLLGEAREIAESIGDTGDFERRIQELGALLGVSGRRLEFGETLTDRELSILRLLTTHLSQRDIGAELYLSINTVKSHTRAIYRKLGATTRAEAVRKAREQHLLG